MRLTNTPKITHVIFDLDGTLIDSERVYEEVDIRIMARIGKKFTPEVKRAMLGRSRAPAMKIFHEMMDLDGLMTVEELTSALEAELPAALPTCPLMPGALQLVRHLAARKLPMAICSGSLGDECRLKLQNLKELRDLIPLIVTSSDPEIHRGKPAPDAFLVTMQRFKTPPESPSNVLVFEDSPSGVRAAVAAGMRVVMLHDTRYSDPPEDLLGSIDCIFNSFTEFVPSRVGLPPYS